jgi:hypothetical protein
MRLRLMESLMKDQRIPPYLPFSSFITALDQLAQAVPNVIHKDVFPYHSGLLQAKVIGALRFFDLIDERGIPKGDNLERLASQKEIQERKANLGQLLKKSYSHIIKLNLIKVTPSQLDSAFSDYGISGDTKKKAKTFFLQAAKFSELNLSPLLIRRGRAPLSGKKRRAIQPISEQQNDSTPTREVGTSKIVKLRNGATLTVVVSGSLLELDPTDRDLVFGIMDQIRSHS